MPRNPCLTACEHASKLSVLLMQAQHVTTLMQRIRNCGRRTSTSFSYEASCGCVTLIMSTVCTGALTGTRRGLSTGRFTVTVFFTSTGRSTCRRCYPCERRGR